jgi:ABC-type uncharacterized transport system ATPase subunit
MRKYVWWIKHNDGEIGEYHSEEEAFKALEEVKKLSPSITNAKIVRYVAGHCGCGKWTRLDILKGLGECLFCDHVRSDIGNFAV